MTFYKCFVGDKYYTYLYVLFSISIIIIGGLRDLVLHCVCRPRWVQLVGTKKSRGFGFDLTNFVNDLF